MYWFSPTSLIARILQTTMMMMNYRTAEPTAQLTENQSAIVDHCLMQPCCGLLQMDYSTFGEGLDGDDEDDDLDLGFGDDDELSPPTSPEHECAKVNSALTISSWSVRPEIVSPPFRKPLRPLTNLQSEPLDLTKRKLCEVCPKVLSPKTHLHYHKQRHSGHKLHSCEWANCKWAFIRKDELHRHRRTHTHEKPYSCVLCPKQFSRSDHLVKHLNSDIKKSFPELTDHKPQLKLTSGVMGRQPKDKSTLHNRQQVAHRVVDFLTMLKDRLTPKSLETIKKLKQDFGLITTDNGMRISHAIR